MRPIKASYHFNSQRSKAVYPHPHLYCTVSSLTHTIHTRLASSLVRSVCLAQRYRLRLLQLRSLSMYSAPPNPYSSLPPRLHTLAPPFLRLAKDPPPRLLVLPLPLLLALERHGAVRGPCTLDGRRARQDARRRGAALGPQRGGQDGACWQDARVREDGGARGGPVAGR